MKSGIELAKYCESKLGVPYFYGAKMNVLTEAMMKSLHNSYPGTVTNAYMDKARRKGQVGKVNVDCSGLIGAYRGKQIGSAQLYSSAKKRMPISEIKNFAVGVTLYHKGHVATYIGMENGEPMCIEAKGINYGVVKSKVKDCKFTHGLTFEDIDYSYEVKVEGTSKGKNPYTMPVTTLTKGAKGEGVKWLQWELVEAGYDITIDASYGPKTSDAVRDFQKSCKLVVDNKVGSATRKALLNN